ncbi:protein SHQ1 homolog [Aplysia californica]|uniref:Protein SHQ1 homolog n=1 Tax=Aplysia californica TaxID=6500 RepID=A0ABM0JEX1_APLCA|nr:protein SHQ1 homolog [Aplysia californica]
MLTPKFSLSQDNDFLFINIYAPHLKVKEAECHVNDDEVHFYCQPYYLRLHLPGKVVENERSKSTYDADTGWLALSLPKQHRGEYFENLDMLTKLLTPKSSSYVSAQVEVLESGVVKVEAGSAEVQSGQGNGKDESDRETGKDEGESEGTGDVDESSEFDWYIEQTPVNDEESASSLLGGICYGFALRKTSPLNSLTSELPDMIDLKEPDLVPSKQRSTLRTEQEQESFDCEHYLADLFDDSLIQEVINVKLKELTGTEGVSTILSEKDQELLLQLPRREYIIDDSVLTSVYLGLVDLLLAYAFDFRQTYGEHSVESDWVICKLSSSLSWLDSFSDLKEVVVSFGRRCLCFPLYRNWKLFEKVLSDVKLILDVGKSQILKCLLDMKMILAKSEAHFPLVEIFITDYCVWIQSACPKRLKSLSKALSEIHVCKKDMGFRLEEMEADAAALMAECAEDEEDQDTDLNKLATAISNVVKITDADDSDDESSDETSSEDDSSSSESDSDSENNSQDKKDGECPSPDVAAVKKEQT